MKLRIIITLLLLSIFTQANAVTITKIASNPNPQIGEEFEYTVNVTGITSMTELGYIKDVLDPNLLYLGSDFTTSNSVTGPYTFLCPTQMGSFSVVNTAGTLRFQFPTHNSCGGNGWGSVSFKIKVAVKSTVCGTSITQIKNNVELYNWNSIRVARSNSPAIITIDRTNPWKLTKTFRALSNGFLVYDIRLSSSVSKYAEDVLRNVQFTDDFISDPCAGIDIASSEVYYLKDENNLSNRLLVGGPAIATASGMQMQWQLPPAPATGSPSTYLFQVMIKSNSCTCTTTQFNLLNKVEMRANDVCGIPILLKDSFNLIGAMCGGGGGGGPTDPPKPDTLIAPENVEICASKTVTLDDNNLNLTMKGCTGFYTIKLRNCNNGYKYDPIRIDDDYPLGLDIDQGGITVSPAIYASDLTTTSTGLSLVTNNGLGYQDFIEIKIPFKVITTTPDLVIRNCVRIKLDLHHDIFPTTTKTLKVCDGGIKTVPNHVEVVKFKKVCEEPTHTCGTLSVKAFFPGDEVEYAMHFYNYGTVSASEIVLRDNLPSYINVLNPLTDIKVYKLKKHGSRIVDVCDVSLFTDITASVDVAYNSGGHNMKIGLRNHKLHEFTCAGVTHYIVKVKGQIDLATPNGVYPNVFELKYKDRNNTVFNELSNIAPVTVNTDQMIIIDKMKDAQPTDCINKTKKVSYTLRVLNMGFDPIHVNVDDAITLPSGVTLQSGINSNSVEYLRTPAGSTWNPLVTSGIRTVSITASTLTVRNLEVQPCEMVTIRYTVVYDASNLNLGESIDVCNNVKFTVGFVVSNSRNQNAVGRNLVVVKDPAIINSYFEAKTDDQKLSIIKMTKKINSKRPIFKRSFNPLPNGQIFIAVDTFYEKECVIITDCLNGSKTGCFTPNGGNNFNFSINSINKQGEVSTTFTVNNGAPKVRKVEFILSDIRMLVDPCISPRPFRCFNCPQSVIGNFIDMNPTSLGALQHQFISFPATGDFKEKNKVEFSSNSYYDIAGTYNKTFRLPNTSLNCNGDLEIVITAIVYFDDCSICYVSKAFDYHAQFGIIRYGDLGTSIPNGGVIMKR